MKIRNKITRIILFVTGIMSLLWFLIRVIPKPSRASYPCQRVAFPIASSFVLWVTGVVLSRRVFKKGIGKLTKGNNFKAIALILLSIVIFFLSVFTLQIKDTVIGAINLHISSKSAERYYITELAENDESIIIPKSNVSIIRSDKAYASEITFGDIDKMVREAVELEGSFNNIIHDGDIVILKPNVVTCRASGNDYDNCFPMEANGIATDYRIVQVVVSMTREINRTGKIILIEGSGYGVTRKNMEALGYGNITGLDSIIYLDENIIEWYDLNSPSLAKVTLPDGKNMYSDNNEYFLNKIYYEADVVISLPTLKSHFVAGISGAIKNVGLGAAPVEMYGMGMGAEEDLRVGRWETIDHGDFINNNGNLDKWIHDFYLCKPVNYVIMDGLQGVEFGPYPGSHSNHLLSDVQKNLRIIIAGRDPVAVDAIEALIAGFDPYLIKHLVYLAMDSAGNINPAYIRVRGVQVHEIKTDFNEDMPGRQFKYSDFTPPAEVTVNSWEISDGKINISLNPDAEVVKVEISYDNKYLDQVIISDFESFSLPLPIVNPEYDKIKIHIYDRYLNCTILSLDSSTLINNELTKTFKIYPNPASTSIRVELPDKINKEWTMSVYSYDGRVVLNTKINESINQEVNVSRLVRGIYTVILTSKNDYYFTELLKVD